MSQNKVKVRKKLECVDLQTKLWALHEVSQGTPVNVVAEKINVHKTTIKNWIKSRDSFRQWQKTSNEEGKGKKRMKSPIHTSIDKATWLWFQERSATDFPISGPTVKMQAMKFWKMFGGESIFKASNGWLDKWKVRHKIRTDFTTGMSSLDSEGAEKYKTIFLDIIKNEDLTPHQVFNCDATGLNYKQIPKKTYGDTNNELAGFKIKKKRVTIMICSNASGTLKLPLVLIGKDAKLCGFKSLTVRPVVYKSQKNTWLTSSLFEEWFKEQFVPQVQSFLKNMELPPKAVLFMDNRDGHLENLWHDEIRVEFFPPNISLLIQPMDIGVLQNLKTLYRTSVMSFFIDQFNIGTNLSVAMKKLSIRNVIFWITTAWNKVNKSTISESWKALWPDILQVLAPNDDIEIVDDVCYELRGYEDLTIHFHNFLKDQLGTTVELITVQDWLNSQRVMSEDECLTDSQIVQIIKEEEEAIEEERKGIQRRITAVLQNKIRRLQNKDDTAVTEEEENKRNKKRKTKSGKGETDSEDLCEMLEDSIQKVEMCLDTVIRHCNGNSRYTQQNLTNLYEIKNILRNES
ncbi:PREDICTED: jerky protein homolog-like [Atta colombica]|uniref:jerky protein homolog-like n=1 Tax=Atta colombica TaxID=520822 RepID=UPI00084C8758|nr:PREDICTED: jerky protein homolog-like [Atta colombica]